MAILNNATNTAGEEQPRAERPTSDQQSSSEVAAKKTRQRTAKPKLAEEGKAASVSKAKPASQPKDRPKAEAAKTTKAEQVLKKLRSTKGATIEMLMEATGWQAHSVRGFLSGTVKKKMKLTVVSEVGKDGARRYRIDDTAKPE